MTVRFLRLWAASPVLAFGLASCERDTSARLTEAYRSAPVLELIESIRFCADENRPECQLGPTAFANIAPGGGALVGMSDGPVTRFDSAGAMIARYGRPGSGPGEYRRLTGAHVEPDGRVVLHDLGQSRRLVFSSDGTVLATHTDPPPVGRHDVGVVPRGLVILSDPPGDQGDSVQSNLELLVDTLPPRVIAQLPVTRRATRDGHSPIRGFFEDLPRWAVESDTSALMASGPTLRVTRHFADGRATSLLDLPELGNRPVTPADIEREGRRIVGTNPQEPVVRARLQAVVEAAAARAPAFHPFVARLRALDDGAFVLRETEVRGDSVRWTLLESDGAVLGQFRLDADAEIIGGRRDRLLLLTPDERGVPIVGWFAVVGRR